MSGPTEPRRDLGDEHAGDHGEWDALAVGWALSALEPDDEARFAVHLPECDRCTETVRESLRTVADLAFAVPDEAPPASLKQRIMQAAAAEPRRRTPPPGQLDVEIAAGPDEGEWPLGSRLAEPEPDSDAADWFARPQAGVDPGADLTADPAAEPWLPADDETGRMQEPTGRPERPAPPGDDATGWAGGSAAGAGAAPGLDGSDPRPARPDPAADGAYGWGRHAATEDEAGSPDDLPPNVVPLQSRRRRWTSWVAVAAAVVLIAGLGGWNLRLRSEQADLRAGQDDLRQVVAQRNAAIEQLTRDGPARVAALTADGKPSPARRATVVVRGNRIEIITEGLNASDQFTYWLWTLKCDVTDLKPVQGFKITAPGSPCRA